MASNLTAQVRNIADVTTAVATGDRSHILSGPDEALESHLMVFAAERARRECRVVEVSEA